ncbi:hypothetical protein ACFQ8E_15720 [Isoptericola sp. NPDC056573]|uniref:hypothetical protein n=1 Tax=Isoptericola sp. NPDC056573 TaxID=3345868 RepID=UPI003683F479
MTWSDDRRRRAAAAAWGVPCLALLGACGQGNGEDAFAAREPLPTCGDVTVPQDLDPGEESAELVAGYACLDAATEAEGAELVLRYLSDECDPIVEYWRVGPGIDGTEAYIDATQDTFGDPVWWYNSCPRTVTAAEPRGCDGWPLGEG